MTNERKFVDHDRAIELIAAIPRSELNSIVGILLDNRNVALIGDWSASPVGKSYGTGTIGICIVRGIAEIAGQQQNWSMAAKVLDLSMAGNTAADSARSEIEAYSSGLLDSLLGAGMPDSRFRAANCYGVTEFQKDDVFIIWLEDLSHLPDPPWNDDVYAMSAKHLGHFNAAWLLNPPENRSWFHQDGYRARFSTGPQKRLKMRDNQDDKYVRLVASSAVLDGYEWLTSNLDRVFDHLQTIESPLSHTDAQPKNLFPGTAPDGSAETIAIDWSMLGYAALGTDAANLVGSSLFWLEIDVSHAMHLEQVVFESYLEGLQELGWRGRREFVWLGYLTVATCRAANGSNFPGQWIGNDKLRDSMITNLGHTPTDMANHWREVFEWMFPRFKAATEKAGIL
ncbi:MAG: hypothetical protein V3T49_02225 [Dehalococcoidia bacterium]